MCVHLCMCAVCVCAVCVCALARVCSVRVCSVRVLVCACYVFVSVHQTVSSMVYFMIPPLPTVDDWSRGDSFHCSLTVARLYSTVS